MLEYPAGHDAHVSTVFPTSVVMNLPASQASQKADPAGDVPDVQFTHDAASALALFFPAKHNVQLCAPSASLNVPGRHGKQDACFFSS